MPLRIRKTSYALGAEITGADISKPLDDEAAREIYNAFLEHCVLVFRGQPITRAQHLALGQLFGEVDKNKVILRNEVPGFSEISFVMNQPKSNGEAPEAHYAGDDWHTDRSYLRIPNKATVLRAVELPKIGGDTQFANCYLAYETLSAGMKKLLEGLEGVHVRAGGLHGVEKNQSILRDAEKLAEMEKLTRTAHPIVRTHPETGRKALYLGENLIKYIVGMTPEESAPLLNFLHLHATRPQLVYRHVWQKHDLVIWDNRCTMHYALGDFDRQNQLRHMEKISVIGTPSGYAYPAQ